MQVGEAARLAKTAASRLRLDRHAPEPVGGIVAVDRLVGVVGQARRLLDAHQPSLTVADLGGQGLGLRDYGPVPAGADLDLPRHRADAGVGVRHVVRRAVGRVDPPGPAERVVVEEPRAVEVVVGVIVGLTLGDRERPAHGVVERLDLGPTPTGELDAVPGDAAEPVVVDRALAAHRAGLAAVGVRADLGAGESASRLGKITTSTSFDTGTPGMVLPPPPAAASADASSLR